MDNQNQVKQYLDLAALQILKECVEGKINVATAASIKSIKTLTGETKGIAFYTEEVPTEESTPVYTLELSGDVDLSGLIPKIESPVEGDIATVTGTGTIIGSGVKVDELATRQQTAIDIASAIQNASHLNKTIVDTVPNVEDAEDHTIYLVKDETVTGPDKYREYTKIGQEMVCIGDTSVDLTNYATTDAVANAISTVNESLNAQATRISNLETKVGDGFVAVTEDEIRELFK